MSAETVFHGGSRLFRLGAVYQAFNPKFPKFPRFPKFPSCPALTSKARRQLRELRAWSFSQLAANLRKPGNSGNLENLGKLGNLGSEVDEPRPPARSSIVAVRTPTTLRHSDFDHFKLGPYPQTSAWFVLDVEFRDYVWKCVLAL